MITLLWTVLFCLGWRVVTGEGQLLYFIRRPFEINVDRIEALNLLGNNVPMWRDVMYFFGKPTVVCITCFGSFWGTTWYLILETNYTLSGWVLNCFAAAFIQTFIYKIYARLD